MTRTARFLGLTLVLALGVAGGMGTAPGLVTRAGAQPPAPSPSPPPPPPPDISGDWSITRTWYRRCPACGGTIVRTTPWVITQSGSDVRIDRGPRGSIVGTAAGGGYLALEGLEQQAEGSLRFWYGTLFVDPSGNTFEGGLNGSERIANPCGAVPPIVTCFASGGYLRAQRVRPIATVPTPPGPPTPAPPTATPAPPTRTATTAPTLTAAPSPTPTAAVPTPVPPAPSLFPLARR